MLQSPYRDVRRQGIDLLSRSIQNPRARDVLCETFSRDLITDEAEWIARILAAATAYDPKVATALTALARSGNFRAVAALSAMPDRTAAIESLIVILEDANVWHLARAEAAAALGTIGDERAIGPLTTALRSYETVASKRHYDVAIGAAKGLAALKRSNGIPALLTALDVADELFRAAATRALLELDIDSSAQEPLLRALTDAVESARRQAFEGDGSISIATMRIQAYSAQALLKISNERTIVQTASSALDKAREFLRRHRLE